MVSMDDMIEKALEKAMSKPNVKQKKRKSKRTDPKLWQTLFEESLKKEGYIK